MTPSREAKSLIKATLDRLTAERAALEEQLQLEAELAQQDWLVIEACKDFDTIELDDHITGKLHRKQFKALRDKKRNLEKMIEALHALQETAQAPDGDKLVKKLENEREKYQL